MGAEVETNITNTEQKIINEAVNEFRVDVQNSYETQSKTSTSQTNNNKLVFNNTNVDGLDIDQSNTMSIIVKTLDTIKQATQNGASQNDIMEIAKKVTDKSEKDIGLFSIGITTNVTNEQKETVNKTLNQYSTFLKNNFKTIIEQDYQQTNNNEISAYNSVLKNIGIKQNNILSSENIQEKKVETTTENKADKQTDIKQTEEKIDESTTSSGLNTKMTKYIIIGACVIGGAITIGAVISAVQARKTATDPNLKGNIQATTDLVKQVNPTTAALSSIGKGKESDILRIVIIIMLIIQIIITIIQIVYQVKKNKASK